MKGSLANINVSDLVIELYFTRRSGILRVTQGDVKKSIYLKEGSIVFAHSNLKQERLGEVLLRLGKISDEEFNEVAPQLEAGKRIGELLYEKGYASQSDITSGVGYQCQQIIYSIFNWDSGEYEFVDRDRPVYEDIMVDISTPSMIIEGVRNITNQAILIRCLGADEKRLVMLDSGSVRRLPRTNLDFAEETILACVDGKTSIERLREVTHLNPLEFGRAMYMLMLSGMVGFSRSGEGDILEHRIREQVQKRWMTTQPLPAGLPENLERTMGGRLKTISEPELRRLIIDTEKHFRTATDEEVLKVLPDASPVEIQRAYDQLTEIFHPPYYSQDRYHDVKPTLKIIIDRLTEAYQTLKARAESSRPLSDLHMTPPPLPPQPMQPFLREPRAEPLRPSPRPIEELQVVPMPPAPEPAAPRITVPPPAAAAPPAPVSDSVKAPPQKETAKEMNLADLEAALKKEPNNQEYMRKLGLKLQQAGRAKEGEKLLNRTLEVDPQNIDNHFALVEFYNAQGMKIKSFKHLNVILQIKPDNQRAMEMLGVKKRKKAMYDIGGG